MALHPQAALLLEAAKLLDLPTPPDLDHEVARAAYNHRTDSITLIVEMKSIVDRSIPGPSGEITIRIYRPHGAGADAPALMFFHGGGWVFSTIDNYDAICRLIADTADAVVVSVGYRLAPEHRWPAAADDCLAATRWVAANAVELDVDPSRLAVCGDSAGGNLAAIVAQDCREAGPTLRAQVLVYPMTDLVDYETDSFHRNGEGLALTAEFIHWFVGHYAPDRSRRSHPRCSPVYGELSGLPPALILTAEYDPLFDDGAAYAARLRDAGVDSHLYDYEGQIHSFFTQVGIVDASTDAGNRIAGFLAERW